LHNKNYRKRVKKFCKLHTDYWTT